MPPFASSPLPALSRRLLARLELLEAGEPDPHLRDDVRIAWITVLNAARGESQPFLAATIAVLGCHPDQVWPHIVEQRRCLLGREYEKFYGEGAVPKKPARSVLLRSAMRADRAA